MTLMHFKVIDDRFIFLKEACQWQSFDSYGTQSFMDVYMAVATPVSRVRAKMSLRAELEG